MEGAFTDAPFLSPSNIFQPFNNAKRTEKACEGAHRTLLSSETRNDDVKDTDQETEERPK